MNRTNLALLTLIWITSSAGIHAQSLFGDRGPIRQRRARRSSVDSTPRSIDANATSRSNEQRRFVGRSSNRSLARSSSTSSVDGGTGRPRGTRTPIVRQRNEAANAPSMRRVQSDSGTMRRLPSVRPRYQIEFTPRRSVIDIERINEMLAKLPATTRVIATIERHGVVEIDGHVTSEQYRRLAERLVQFQPGVKQVKNRVTNRP